MKEATGELTNALIVIVSVTILTTFFYFVIWPTINGGFQKSISCEKAVCSHTPDGDGMVSCRTKDGHDIKCKYKG